MMKFLSGPGLFFLMCLLSACQTFKGGDQVLYDQSNKLLSESIQQAQTRVVPPPSVQAALLPPYTTQGPSANEARFDVSAKDMPARDFFLSLMQGAGQNIVVNPDVTGDITFSLRRVTLEEVLGAVRDTYGYDYRRTSYGYQILPNSVITRSYDLNYLNLQRVGKTDTRVSAGQMVSNGNHGNNSNGNNNSNNGNGGDYGSGGNGNGQNNSNSQSTLNASQVTTTSDADFWKEVGKVVEMIVGDDPGNSVIVNPQASLLVVRAKSADQENVARFLDKAQRNLQRQVVLETKILEVQLNKNFQAGISWTKLGGDLGTSLTGAALTGPTAVGGVFSSTINVGDFSGLIQLLETQGEVRVLSSPRISTLNNQKAVIKVGSDEFFVTDVSSTSGTTTVAGVTQPTQNVTLTPFFSGISLDVTPQIDQNDTVTLHVRPTVSRVTDQNKTITLGVNNVLELPLALSTTRQSDSIVRAHSGQVVVIGGLLQNSSDDSNTSVPWASKLPIIGNLFKQQRNTLQKSELVILMRPQVVNDDVWLGDLRKTAETFKDLK
ncbi:MULTISPECIES: secretin N-terminal domain-containing protein [unclassified Pseudomonas]|uniref:secretin N-terminal domain-containing protein n=1 Tax=unclassified Pseudomonas TaxID=196821 RepID=UPI002ACB188A|nr:MULTISPECIES: secretin N-terminal domain-containing protein [unclassified Pseudomonas]MEB0039935.1 secretin N-terminal domain-containing protein [Pseudomonas sp. MH10]MEB0089733.1 secretin N-terminal domain-containing protein [Pseudomonas sp. CCI4.2]MEB0121537.1 secretin N-terminal domain-containing protein [Pseudomonas sp. CCI1.2]WPX54064.1 secretin N-terminal domain-containing protein [Pseudomonas sp. CCI4.2]WPX66115.1 secretin N-terminal domain-containing protein [Pseudomonas sp. MH10]